jgi:hippurate hydrolase
VRSYAPEVRRHLHDAIVRKAEALAAAAGAPQPEVTFSEPTDPLVNDADVSARVTAALARRLGAVHVVEVRPQMVAEDFGRFGQAGIPIFMFRLGTTAPDRLRALADRGGPPGLHTAGYWPDAEPALRTAITASVAAMRELLRRR